MTHFSRRLGRVLLTFFVGLLVVTRVSLQADDLVYSRFGDYLESQRAQTGIPGLAAAIVGRTDILWERAFGYADLERSIGMRTDTPVPLDGLTEAFSAALVLRCVEEGRLSLDGKVLQAKGDNPDTAFTLTQLLTHTTAGSASNPVYSYRPDLLAPVTSLIRSCTGDSFREMIATQLAQLAMKDSVPGMDVAQLAPPAEGVPSPEALERYQRSLARMALPYSVDSKLRATLATYSSTTLTPTTGIVSTVRDVAQFDLALRGGFLLKTDTVAFAWRGLTANDGARLPHGIGWFSQNYNGENVVWQFGNSENGSSSLVITLPARSLTLVLLANSNGLSKGFHLSSGDLTTSPFARLFLGLFATK